jgi:hypothetical protein
MCPVGRLFFEIGGDTSRLNASIAVFEFAKDAAEAATQIQNLSYGTGKSVERVQALNRAGQEKGLGDLTGSIEKLTFSRWLAISILLGRGGHPSPPA